MFNIFKYFSHLSLIFKDPIKKSLPASHKRSMLM